MRFTSLLTSTFLFIAVLAAPVAVEHNNLSRRVDLNDRALGVDVRNIVGDATDAIERGYKNNILYTRNYKPLPSVALIMQQLRVVPNKSLFYSGLGGYQAVARQIAKAKGLQILEDSWIDRNYPNTWKGSPDEKIFWFRSSEAFALLSKGTTYVCLSKDVGVKNFHEKSIWAMIEFPTLLKNPDVTAIIRVDVDDFLSKQQPHSRSQVIHKLKELKSGSPSKSTT